MPWSLGGGEEKNDFRLSGIEIRFPCLPCHNLSAVERGRGGTNSRGPTVRDGARGPPMLHTFLSFSVYHYLSTVEINSFRPSPSYSAADSQSFRFSVKICSRSVPTWGGGGGTKTCFHWDPNPLSAALHSLVSVLTVIVQYAYPVLRAFKSVCLCILCILDKDSV
jgi:hypothetical protein